MKIWWEHRKEAKRVKEIKVRRGQRNRRIGLSEIILQKERKQGMGLEIIT